VALVGGFLGAGKTTLLTALAAQAGRAGRRVAVITNDQGGALADSQLVAAAGIAGAEVAGGCFCCRFEDLVSALERVAALDRVTAAGPGLDSGIDLVLAEAVGSCTDLVATVYRPLARLHGDRFAPLPVTVVVDPLRHGQLDAFPADIGYLFGQQVREADLVVVNKTDVAGPAEVAAVEELVARINPAARVLRAAARTGDGVAEWYGWLTGPAAPGGVRALGGLDYDRYAAAEAELAWLNASAEVTAGHPFDLDGALDELSAALDRGLAGARAAHVKLLASGTGGVSQRNLTGAGPGWDRVRTAPAPTAAATVLVNARVCTEPGLLEHAVRAALGTLAGRLDVRVTHLECFRPARPVPSHRDLEPAELTPPSG
jgi:Ni2+-binding GTPase involved in maturation of urease and hydrogenase